MVLTEWFLPTMTYIAFIILYRSFLMNTASQKEARIVRNLMILLNIMRFFCAQWEVIRCRFVALASQGTVEFRYSQKIPF